MTDRLRLYNDALLLAGERALASLTDTNESRRVLDQVWNSNGVRKCLEQGQWFFAMRTIKIDYDPDIEPDYGYNRAFQKPTDWVLTSALCQDEFFRSPQLRYVDEGGYWYSDIDSLYVRYVSDDASYGLDLNRWPDSFEEFVATFFASRVIMKLTQDGGAGGGRLEHVMKLLKIAKTEAKSRAAMADPTHLPAMGQWAKSRLRTNRNDRGNVSGSLIG